MAALPRVLELLWERGEPRRGPKPKFGIRDIAGAAIAVADGEGLGAVSMARVATDLGVTTMALYRYVDSKDDLLLAMIDTAYGAPPRRAVTGDWRAQLQSWARANHRALARHPWIVQITLSDPPLGPNTTAWMERGLRAFADTGLGQQERLSALLLVEVYIRGQVLLAANFLGGEALAVDADGTAYARTLREVMDPERFPALVEALGSGALEDDGDLSVEEFEFGLQTVLDGIAALVSRQRR
jgi:AcrR family transcriptional regulator